MHIDTDDSLERHALALFKRLDRLAVLVEAALGTASNDEPDWRRAIAFRWQRSPGPFGAAQLQAVTDPALIAFSELCNVERQAEVVRQNTRQFVMGYPANNVLLTGARGTGKSSLVKACLHAFAPEGLRLIEAGKESLNDLPAIIDRVRHRPERFIVFCDDLSFESGETGYKGLKTVLDGSVAGHSSNVLIYATSNRRHLLAENASDNNGYTVAENGELHPGDAVEEKISLSERFGIWLTFYAFTQDEYLDVVAQRLTTLGFTAAQIDAAQQPALQWALARGARSGRIAMQFAQDYAGRLACTEREAVSAASGAPGALKKGRRV
ncbi:ATP-binding protein [Burkholderia sp. WSM2232]|uniref:ATP-binding protein n=1 Tax=Burkholderia sp. WSM2232 TaxID=944436 RepID=UPI00068617D4|nr:ATP-binding protein [Burkholderia sp. WSM2232]